MVGSFYRRLVFNYVLSRDRILGAYNELDLIGPTY